MKAEFLVVVDGLKPEERDKFLAGFMNSLSSSKVEFTPPHDFNVRALRDEEREALATLRAPAISEDLAGRIAYGLEQFMTKWDEIPWDLVPLDMRRYKADGDDGPIGGGRHPQFGWFVLASGQGPFLVWCETPMRDLAEYFKDFRPLGGTTEAI